jgi:chromosome partitioning protein
MLHVFIDQLSTAMGRVDSRLKRDLTMRSRVTKRFSIREAATLLDLDRVYLTNMISKMAEEDPSFPGGLREGRERTFDPAELLQIRAYLHTKPASKRPYLHWRQPGDPLRIVTFGAQKGGTGKSLTAAHFAQYLSMFYGLRVGVIDCDPQATISLYFADNNSKMFSDELQTVASFMGVDNPEETWLRHPPVEELNGMWEQTPWPGMRLIPGGPDIQMGDIALFNIAKSHQVPAHSVLRDAIARWDDAYGPQTRFEDLRRADGSFDEERYQHAVNETVDIIIIDQQPSFTLMQLNGLVAATSTVIPQTMKGFDLSTLASYSGTIATYLGWVGAQYGDTEIGLGRHVVLPTIVQERNNQDIDQVLDLYSHAPEVFLQVWYARSDAVANAAEEYKSIYEYDAPKARRASALAFTENANAVNDALVQVSWPELPSRGYAQDFINQRWGE